MDKQFVEKNNLKSHLTYHHFAFLLLNLMSQVNTNPNPIPATGPLTAAIILPKETVGRVRAVLI